MGGAGEADEIFVTNSIQEIVPVARLENEQGQTVKAWAGGTGEAVLRLMRLYRSAAERNDNG